MQHKDALVHKIYGVRYIPHGDLFEAKLGANPSLAWRGIWKARKVLMRGRRWRVGDGLSAKIWTEPWFPDFDNLDSFFRVNIDDLSYEKVTSLLDSHTHRWDESTISLMLERQQLSLNFNWALPLGQTTGFGGMIFIGISQLRVPIGFY